MLGDRLAALITTSEQQEVVREVYRIIGDDILAETWILQENPFLGEESPLVCIQKGLHLHMAVIRAARAFDEGTVNL